MSEIKSILKICKRCGEENCANQRQGHATSVLTNAIMRS